MAGFTDEEVDAALQQFLLSQVSVPTTTTGARDIVTLQSQLYDLLTTAFLLRPDSYFYVIFLARNRLMSLVAQQLADLDTIISAGPNTTRPSKKVNSTTDLSAAQAALLDLNAGLNDRSTGVRGSIGPAVSRFSQSVSSFVSSELTKNVVVSGSVTETGPELQSLVAATWAKAVDRHAQIMTLSTNISDALTSLAEVKLPESSIRDIVSRVSSGLSTAKTTMESTAAIEQSRTVMLELLTMRTLITKASTFRNPELILMPKTGDTSLVTFVDSPGAQAFVEGSISGPFNYAPGTTLSLSVNGGTPVTVPLPGTSRAELRSKVFSIWVAPTPGDDASFVVDLGATSTFLIGGAYASGPLAAAALNAGLGPAISVTWDAGTSQLVFQSTNSGDNSHLRLLTDTSIRQSFRAWAFPVASVVFTENQGTAIQDTAIVAAVAAASPLVEASTVSDDLADFRAVRTAVGGEEASLWDRRDSGADLASTGLPLVSSPSKNFKTLGIKPGMALHTTAPTVADYAISAVDTNTLTLDPAPPSGTLTYYIGPDYRTIPDGARVQVTSGSNRDNSGLYRVAASGGKVASIVVDRNLQAPDTGLGVSVFQRFIVIDAVGTTTSSGIGASAGTGATALGITPSSEKKAGLTRLQLQGPGDFIVRGAQVGDVVRLTSPTSLLYVVNIAEVNPTYVLISQTTVPYEAGNWTYEVRSAKAEQYETLQAGVASFLSTPYALNFSLLDSLVGRLINGARYGGDIQTGIADYRSSLDTMNTVLSTYVITKEMTIDNVVKMMREQGLDRALDLFLTLDVITLFTMDSDGVSYATCLVRQSATVATQVVPVSKFARSDRVVQEWRPTSFQPDPFDPRGGNT